MIEVRKMENWVQASRKEGLENGVGSIKEESGSIEKEPGSILDERGSENRKLGSIGLEYGLGKWS
jgi:hypothetical protein